ncbi:glycerophosphodiester phosphodiesterase family protein [Paenibacillus macerans]|uniref:glycerophosphodiester phosphodiesterase n=1 Tax=Paenibacillus macerans TaxID=44252 RepID=UPI00203AA457|nr:glycerophosphodiester phosphodiesterase family protein [Paenibacillus macerans]MCM3703914.1 glycerophosphodiester phosphodiesterase [Paenibacillus macerans]
MRNQCVAHRGFSGIAPENTMAAVKLAMEQPDVRWIEVDVQLSKDGVPLLIHDFTLNRTTSGRGPVKDKTWAELQELDAGSWKSQVYAGERLLGLSEFLDAIAGRLRANIEIKTEGDLCTGLEEKVISAVKRRHMEQEVVLTSFEPRVLAKIREIGRSIRTGLIIDHYPKDLLLRLQLLRCNFLSIHYRALTAELVDKAFKRGIEVMAWTMDEVRTLRKVAALHPGILLCTNRPDVWRKAILNWRKCHDEQIDR